MQGKLVEHEFYITETIGVRVVKIRVIRFLNSRLAEFPCQDPNFDCVMVKFVLNEFVLTRFATIIDASIILNRIETKEFFEMNNY